MEFGDARIHHYALRATKASAFFTRNSPEMSLGRSVSRRAASVRDSLQFASTRLTRGSISVLKARKTSFVGLSVDRDLTCVELRPGMATPVPLILISSIVRSDESQKKRKFCPNSAFARSR